MRFFLNYIEVIFQYVMSFLLPWFTRQEDLETTSASNRATAGIPPTINVKDETPVEADPIIFNDDSSDEMSEFTEETCDVTRERVLNLVKGFDDKNNTTERCLAMSVKVVAFLGNLSVCENMGQVIGALSQFGASFVDHVTVGQLLKLCIGTAEEEAYSEHMRKWLETAKTSWQNARFAPVCAGVTNFVALAVSLNYIKESDVSLSVGQLEIVSNAWFKTTIAEKLTDPVALIMECLSFAVDIVEAVELQTLDHLFRPTSIVRTVAELRALADDFRNGTLYDNHNIDHVSYELKLQTAKFALEQKVRAEGAKTAVWSAMLTDIVKIYTEVRTRNSLSKPRRQPFCYLLYGGSGVGKSTLIPKLNAYLLKGLNVISHTETGQEGMYAKINLTERYESTITADKKVYELDDAGQVNSKDEGARTVSGFLIDNVNNSPCYALRADVAGKGAILKEPEIISVTSNLMDAGVTKESALPEAPSSRMHQKWIVRPREQYRTSSGRLDQRKANNAPNEEHHEFRRYELVYTQGGSYSVRQVGEWITTRQFIQILVRGAQSHRKKQEMAVEGINRARESTFCQECCSPQQWCSCGKHAELVDEFFQDFTITPVLQAELLKYTRGVRKGIFKYTRRFVLNRFTYYFLRLLLYNRLAILCNTVLVFTITLALPFVADMHVVCAFGVLWVYLALAAHAYAYVLHHAIARRLADELLSGELPAAFMTWFGCAVGMLSAIMTLQRLAVVSQGVILEPTPEDIERRQSEENHFFSYAPTNPAPPAPTSTATREQAVSKYVQNLARATAMDKEGHTLANNAFFLKGQVAMINTHFVKSVAPGAKVRLNYGEVTKPTIESHFEVLSDYGDLTKVRFTSAAIHTDLTKWISLQEHAAPLCTQLLTRRKDGNLVVLDLHSTPTASVTWKHAHPGWSSTPLDKATVQGDCGGILVSAEGPAYILGLHMARARLTNTAYAGAVHESMIRDDVLEMEIDGTIECDLNNLEVPHERSVVHYGTSDEEGDAPMYVTLGSCPHLRSRAKTHVSRTLLSPLLESLGYPCNWGPPKFDVNRNHSSCFQFATHPMSPFPIDALQWAIRDYTRPMLNYITKYSKYFSSDKWKPLDAFEMVNGREDTRYMRPMNLKTSAGYGLKGKKLDHVLEHVDADTGKKTHTLKDNVMEMVNLTYAKLANGMRCSPVFKSCLKDEPTKLYDAAGGVNKKVRLFFTMPFAFLAVGRSVLMPVAELISTNAVMMECGVGLQTESSEWADLRTFIYAFGDNIMEGDYSKYDMRISIQLIGAVSRVFYTFASQLPYSPVELTILLAWFADVMNPIYAFAGAVIMYYGFNPSGNPVTVYINSVVNSLLHRMFFYDVCMEKLGKVPGEFREFVHLITYGDDSVAGVHPSIPFFNMVNFQVYLKRFKMPYTDARKSEVLPHYTSLEQTEFCKRRWVFIPHIEVWSAPLLESSILKSLHCTRSTRTPKQQAIDIIIQSLQKFSFHEPHVFEEWHTRLYKVATDLGLLEPLRPYFDRSYVHWWYRRKERYKFTDEQLLQLAKHLGVHFDPNVTDTSVTPEEQNITDLMFDELYAIDEEEEFQDDGGEL